MQEMSPGGPRRGCPGGAARAAVLLALALTLPLPARAQQALAEPRTAARRGGPDLARLDRVLVYSTRARVYRTAWVTLPAAKDLTLAELPESVEPGSLRVESDSATVVRVAAITARGQLPRQAQASKLLGSLEGLMDRLNDLGAKRSVLQAEVSFIAALSLSRERPAVDQRGKRQPAEGMFADAWLRVLTWMDTRGARLRAQRAALAGKERALRKALHAQTVKAQTLNLAAVGRPVRRVVGTLRGRPGRHRVTVSYMVPAVQWKPSYDLRYDPARRQVEAVYYAMVQQRSGEDWKDARLRFSTGTPTQLLAIPELPTWTVGRKRDFTPRPARRAEAAPTAWRPRPTREVVDPVVLQLRRVLSRASGKVTRQPSLLDGASGGPTDRRGKGRGTRNERDSLDDLMESSVSMKKEAPAEKLFEGEELDEDSGDAPPEPTLARPVSVQRLSSRRSFRRTGGRKHGMVSLPGGSSSGKPSERVPWGDAGYRPPRLDPDLPVSSAQGYRFTLYAPGKHGVPASGEVQRVPLLHQSFDVKPVYKILPGASKWAYLMATVKNDSGRPILRGTAHLFSGTMFRGRSWLNTALPGRTIHLPLGVDDAVKVERHLLQRTAQQGVVFKDDRTEYTVKIQVANNHRYPIEVEVQDQIPKAMGEKVEVEGFSAKPAMVKPDDQGRVRWTGTIPGRAVKKLSFSFRIIRPRDWELRQH